VATVTDDMPHRIEDLVGRLRARCPERVVVQDPTAALTGTALSEAVEETRRALGGTGIEPGDRVAIVGENSAAMAIAYFAATAISAWPVLLNARLTAVEIDRICKHAGPRALLFTTAASPAAAKHAQLMGTMELTGNLGLKLAMSQASAPERTTGDPSDVAALLYTSGTTGEPKGVMLTHANLLSVARQSGALRRVGPADRVYAVLPVSHVFGLSSVFLASLTYGAEVRLEPRFDAETVARALAEDGITVFQGVPAMYARLMELAALRGAALPAPRLRYLSSGGAPLDPGLKRRVEAMWGQPLHNGYGLTETSPTVATTRVDSPAEDESVGRALPGVELRIAEPATGRALPAGETGEIWVRGPGVMKGYYNAPEETAKAITPDGWLKSGDLGRLDAQGNLYVVGRLKELIIRSGFNVYPSEIEAVLTMHPDVGLAAVVGKKVESNEEVFAFLEPKPGRTIDIEGVRAFATERLAPYKRPSRYLVQAPLPMTSAGKIRKAELARLLERN
jgi:acyl-CoA synthetase (AMP-forming)/AMP-acid ligase II